MMVFPGVIANAIRQLLGKSGAVADQHQANGLWGVHQLRVKLPEDATVYRVIIAPENAPIRIGDIPADEHFSYPLSDETPMSARILRTVNA